MEEKSIKERIFESASHAKAPIVFISYDTAEISLAHFIASLIECRCDDTVKVFIAKRDIPPGADPFRIMIKENLLKASHIVSICTRKSKLSNWLWWETASVWAKGGVVYPLYVDISPDEFGDPIKSLSQGRSYFKEIELQEMVGELLGKLGMDRKLAVLTENEKKALTELSTSVNKAEAQSKKYFSVSRITKASHPLGELFNISDKDLIEMEIKLWALNALGEYELRDPRVVNSGDAPLTASPFNLRTIRKNETKLIYNFPRIAKTKFVITGREAHGGLMFEETHEVN